MTINVGRIKKWLAGLTKFPARWKMAYMYHEHAVHKLNGRTLDPVKDHDIIAMMDKRIDRMNDQLDAMNRMLDEAFK